MAANPHNSFAWRADVLWSGGQLAFVLWGCPLSPRGFPTCAGPSLGGSAGGRLSPSVPFFVEAGLPRLGVVDKSRDRRWLVRVDGGALRKLQARILLPGAGVVAPVFRRPL